MKDRLTLCIIGGGAAGFFGAISCASHFPDHRILLLEKSRQILSKVKISGGGRCNVTHACFDPKQLITHYPRGNKELLGPFNRFQPRDTIQWFESRGVSLKTEEDGRIFPVSDNSESIIQCLMHEAKELGVELLTEHGLEKLTKTTEGFDLQFSHGQEISCHRILLATGSNSKIYSLIEQFGHTIVPLVPSLFTFNIPTSPFLDLSGISVSSALIKFKDLQIEQKGPLLFTHWGLSGPAVLKLSAWGARDLHQVDYCTEILINWVPELTENQLRKIVQEMKESWKSRLIGTDALFSLPKQLWKKLLQLANISSDFRWAEISRVHMENLIKILSSTPLKIQGKTTYKQEFVTAGGIALEEVNFKTMESKKCPGLYFAGEILNIDGVTGGFNFQNAWTTGWIAGQSMGI